MKKCERCGRKGLFLKLQDGLCENCIVVVRTEVELKSIEKQRDSTREEAEKWREEAEKWKETLADETALYQEIFDKAKADALEQAEREIAVKTAKSDREIAKRIAESDEAVKLNEEQVAAAQREERKLLKSIKTAENSLSKLSPLLYAVQRAVERASTDYPLSAEKISQIVSEMENLFAPSVTLELQCLSMRELRKRYRENEKRIEDVLERYKDRYQTKANATIYTLTVIALKAELQNLLFNIKFGKLDKTIEQLKEIMRKYYLIAADGSQSIAPTMRKFIGELEYLFEQSVRIEYEYYVQKERAKEEQRAIREQMRQEAAERKALEAERKKVEKEESKFVSQIEAVQEQLHATEDLEKIAQLEARLKELQEQKAMVEEKKEQIITLQNGKAGNVYVISNLGAFGDDVFKIGMTRRMEPQERIDELGSASVPFPFDVHSFIFSDDAVGLESKLHKILNDRRVNKVNLRKEFFRIPIDELEKLVLEIEPTADFKMTMLAEQYRQSQSIVYVSENPSDMECDKLDESLE